MNAYDRLPEAAAELFGPGATAERSHDLLTVDVPPQEWLRALRTARSTLGCTFFDWLSAVDEPGTGFRVCAHVAALGRGTVRRLLLRTTVPHDAPSLPTAVDVYAGADWHERETHEMFGVDFTGHPHLHPLLLPEGFEGHPLRKDFVLAARVAKAWPGAKEPGESEHGGPKRRQMLPPGVPDPNEWGPLKGQLPPAPARPARAARGAAAGERPVRRTRSASGGSASQAAGTAASPEPGTASDAPAAGERPPRRNRSAAEGSASQPAPPASRPRRNRSAAEGSASQSAPPAPGTGPDDAGTAPQAPRSADAPWHHARPAFDDAGPGAQGEPPSGTGGRTAPDTGAPGTDRPEEHAPEATDGPGTDRPTGGDPA
ncbi:NADH-quinone oxidoreductase subunit C [Streptomyces sp. C10-9-1]|uniref:NADH-quinone oxidoreductase subunit C n=1 Tax=Streptomyces sp. C10-9-1 TaxID=1859285 RepID=UPI002111890B|nr:NADH-quinone oxidoreductase subunit C [Streptomyces sp. C10-9-1]MCQ6555143.1 NADH-quinone oxidoreductase subunit C [Streptomyces sp. C10-9-1]